jgi:hypothetical protein
VCRPDFFNIHTTLMLVLKCKAKSCLIVNPHLFDLPRDTTYGTNSVLRTVVPGTDTMSFYSWPSADMRAPKKGGPLRISSTTEITDAKLVRGCSWPPPRAHCDVSFRLGCSLHIALFLSKLRGAQRTDGPRVQLAEAATLVPELEGAPAPDDDAGADGGGDALGASVGTRGWTSYTNKTVGWNAKELWRVDFHDVLPAGVGRASIVTIDTIANRGAKILNTTFTTTSCNLGRVKSSHAVIQGCTFSHAGIPNLEITYLPQFFEGPVDISNVTLTDNIITGDGPEPIHCGPLCEMKGCQDERSGGKWVLNHSCAACPGCTEDTHWTRGVVLRNNTIVP